jgi:hypothetical protein
MSGTNRIMSPDTPGYYMPYESGEDTDVDYDSDYDSDDLPDNEDARIRREEDPRYAIIRAAGPNFNTSAQQLKYMEHAPGSEYNVNTNITSLSSLTYLNPPKTTQTSLFSIKSTNRDKRVWNTPYYFQIKTPRVYKNVTKFQLVQLSFPNNNGALATFENLNSSVIQFLENKGFTSTCLLSCLNTFTNTGLATTSIGVLEQGRTNAVGQQIMTKLEIPVGLYSNDRLAAELTSQSNNTPPLNIISYDDFKSAFQATRDISLLFNEPGDNFHSNLSPQRHGRHTKETIMNTYFSQHHIDIHPIITDTIAFNAYYFPVLKELAATAAGRYIINITGSGFPSRELAVSAILGNFRGLNNAEYYILCSTNRIVLDEFRKNLTFHHRNINRYQWSFNSAQNRFVCIHDSLHTSLKNDIQGKISTFLNQELSLNGLTANSFTSLKTNYAANNAIFKHLESNLSTVLSNYMFGEQYQYFGGASHSTNGGIYDAVINLHGNALFTALFSYTSTFGQQFGNQTGKVLSFTNFLDYHTAISSYYNLVQTSHSTISSIHGQSYDRHHQYVAGKYTGVLPYEMITNKSYINSHSVPAAFVGNRLSYTAGEAITETFDECVAECKKVFEQQLAGYYSCLPAEGISATISYRLGTLTWPPTYSSLVTNLNIISAQNFNFLMQINNDQSFTNMDIAMNEDYNRSNQTTSQIKLMSAKILTGGVGAGEVTETCIQNPILFENTLGKLDKLEFKLYADDDTLTPMWLYFPFDLPITEWDATFQIDEEIAFADRGTGWGSRPTVPMPTNPALMPYLALSVPGNPNNK